MRIATDGACLGTPGPTGWARVKCHAGHHLNELAARMVSLRRMHREWGHIPLSGADYDAGLLGQRDESWTAA